MSKLVPPHGSDHLMPLLVPATKRAEALKRARTLKSVPMTSRETSDFLMLAMGAYTPLSGFMGYDDWRGSCAEMEISGNLFWPIPITLSCDKQLADDIALDEDVALVDETSAEIMGILKVAEKYSIDKAFECRQVFGTDDPKHPGVAKVLDQGEINLGGDVTAFSEGRYPEQYKGFYFRPDETRALFEAKGWSRVAAFQTRNPMHRSHEHMAKIAIEVCDGVLIHQVLGALKPGDFPADVRVKAIEVLTENYFVPDTYIQAGYPIEMRYAGPREALLHALFRQNFGCSHMMIGRDHAGVGDYYGPFDAHHIFDAIDPDSLVTKPIKIGVTFYCFKCDGMATDKTCPHNDKDRLQISGTRLREMF
ncbi:MAG: sulfate adenylyltransferase, partial [Micropepsaceae bacterium]